MELYMNIFINKNLYAVKIQYGDIVEEDMINEASCTMRLNHPNIIRLFSIGFIDIENEHHQYLVYPVGISLRHWIESKELNNATTNIKELSLSFVYQLLCGVRYCHSRNVIHRDLKPGNLLIINGVLKIMDFGSAIALSCSGSRPLGREAVVTLNYRSPEILLQGNYDEESDKWSLGCIIYEIFTSQKLFPGESEYDQLITIFQTLGSPSSLDLDLYNTYPEWTDYFLGYKGRGLGLGPGPGPGPGLDLGVKIKDTQGYGMINNIILSLLEYNPSNRSNLRDLINLPLFDRVRRPIYEDIQWYNCIDNLDLRCFYPPQIIKEGKDFNSFNFLDIFATKAWVLDVVYYLKYIDRTYYNFCYLFHLVLSLSTNILKEDLLLISLTCLEYQPFTMSYIHPS